MDKAWWVEYRRALGILAAATSCLIASVATGYSLAQIDAPPPASAVTPAPAGTGQLGRAPAVAPVERTRPPAVKRAPKTESPRREKWRTKPRPSSSPSTPTLGSPSPSAAPQSPTPVEETPASEVSATPS